MNALADPKKSKKYMIRSMMLCNSSYVRLWPWQKAAEMPISYAGEIPEIRIVIRKFPIWNFLYVHVMKNTWCNRWTG